MLPNVGSEKHQLQDEDQEHIKRRAKLEFDVKDLEEGVVDDQRAKVFNTLCGSGMCSEVRNDLKLT